MLFERELVWVIFIESCTAAFRLDTFIYLQNQPKHYWLNQVLLLFPSCQCGFQWTDSLHRGDAKKKCHHGVGCPPWTGKSSQSLPQLSPCVTCPVHTLNLVRSSRAHCSFYCHCSPLSYPRQLVSWNVSLLSPAFVLESAGASIPHLGQNLSCSVMVTQRFYYSRLQLPPRPTQDPRWGSELTSLSSPKIFSHNKNTLQPGTPNTW